MRMTWRIRCSENLMSKLTSISLAGILRRAKPQRQESIPIGFLFGLWTIIARRKWRADARLDEIINEAKAAREVKRAVRVKMSTRGCSQVQIGQVLNVSPQYVSKGKRLYETVAVRPCVLGIRGVRAICRPTSAKRFWSGWGREKP
jgi:hypothetical protein